MARKGSASSPAVCAMTRSHKIGPMARPMARPHLQNQQMQPSHFTALRVCCASTPNQTGPAASAGPSKRPAEPPGQAAGPAAARHGAAPLDARSASGPVPSAARSAWPGPAVPDAEVGGGGQRTTNEYYGVPHDGEVVRREAALAREVRFPSRQSSDTGFRPQGKQANQKSYKTMQCLRISLIYN